jgi:hypothetical protein
MKRAFVLLLILISNAQSSSDRKLFSPGAWISYDPWEYRKFGKFGCIQKGAWDSRDIECNVPSAQDFKLIKEDFLARAPFALSLLADVKVKTYDKFKQDLIREAQALIASEGENNYSDFLMRVSSEVDKNFQHFYFSQHVRSFSEFEMWFSPKSPYLGELSKMQQYLEGPVTPPEIYDYLYNNNRSNQLERSKLGHIMGGISDAEKKIGTKRLKLVYGLNFSRYLSYDKSCDVLKKLERGDKLEYIKYFFSMTFRDRLSNDDPPSKTTDIDQVMVKELILKKPSYKIKCQSYSKSKFENAPVDIDPEARTITITLPYYLWTCHWWSCEGESGSTAGLVSRDKLVNALWMAFP